MMCLLSPRPLLSACPGPTCPSPSQTHERGHCASPVALATLWLRSRHQGRSTWSSECQAWASEDEIRLYITVINTSCHYLIPACGSPSAQGAPCPGWMSAKAAPGEPWG